MSSPFRGENSEFGGEKGVKDAFFMERSKVAIFASKKDGGVFPSSFVKFSLLF